LEYYVPFLKVAEERDYLKDYHEILMMNKHVHEFTQEFIRLRGTFNLIISSSITLKDLIYSNDLKRIKEVTDINNIDLNIESINTFYIRYKNGNYICIKELYDFNRTVKPKIEISQKEFMMLLSKLEIAGLSVYTFSNLEELYYDEVEQ